MLNYNIKGTGLSVSDEIRTYVEKRLAHADKFLQNDSTAHLNVEVEYAEMRDGGKYRAEFTISCGSAIYRVEEWGSTLHEAIDISIGALNNELRQAKKKKLHVFRRTAVHVKEYLRGWRRKV